MGVENIELVYQSNGGIRLVIGRAIAAIRPDGKLTVRMRMEPGYSHLRALYRFRIEDYLDTVPWYRKRNYGDHYA